MKSRVRFAVACVLGGAVTFVLAAAQFGWWRRGDSPRAGLQVKAVSIALERYAAAHAGRLPDLMDREKLAATLLPYTESPSKEATFDGKTLALPLLERPDAGDPYVFNQELSGRYLNRISHPEAVVEFYESRAHSGGRLVSFLDGHHIWATDAEWTKLAASASGASH